MRVLNMARSKKLDTRVFTTPTSREEIERGFNYTPKSEEETSLFGILRMLSLTQEELDKPLSEMPPAMLDDGNRFALRTKQYVTYAEDIKKWFVFNGRYCQEAPKWFLFKCVDLVSQGLERESRVQYALRDVSLDALVSRFCKNKPLSGSDLSSKLVELQDRVMDYLNEHPEENLHPDSILPEIYKVANAHNQAGALLAEAQKIREGKQPVMLLEQSAGCYGVLHKSEDYDKDGLLKVVQNGTLDLRFLDTPEQLLRPSLPTDLNTMCMNVAYNPLATAPHVEEQLSWVFIQPGLEDNQKPEMLKYARMLLGGALDSTRVKGTFLILSGIAGSGKSILLSALSHIFGTYVAHVDGSFFLDNPNRGKGDASPHLAKVVSKSLVIATEVKNASSSQLDEAFIKLWTSGTDYITYRGLYQDEKSFLPRGQLVMSTNELPRLSGDKAVGDRHRLAVHHCSRTVPPEMRQDENILQDTLAKEAPGFLNILLQGLRERNVIQGRIVPPASLVEYTSEYVASQDEVEEFFKACSIEANPQDGKRGASSEMLYQAYVKHKGENSTDLLSLKMFSMKLQGRGFRKIRTEKGFFWKGIVIPEKGKGKPPVQATKDMEPVAASANGNGNGHNGHSSTSLLQDLAEMDEAFNGIEGL
jgi:P4 family phage/plasmid primase-like protien